MITPLTVPCSLAAGRGAVIALMHPFDSLAPSHQEQSLCMRSGSDCAPCSCQRQQRCKRAALGRGHKSVAYGTGHWQSPWFKDNGLGCAQIRSRGLWSGPFVAAKPHHLTFLSHGGGVGQRRAQ